MRGPSPLWFAAGGLGLLVLAAASSGAKERAEALDRRLDLGLDRGPQSPLPGRPRGGSAFGWRTDPFTGKAAFHPGLDIPVPVGTPLYAPLPGEVVRIDRDGVGRGVVNGNAVFLRTSDQLWAFLHLSVVVCTSGARVQRGQLLGKTGQTGRTTGPHLHLQVYDRNGNVVDPRSVLPPETFAGRTA